MNWLNQELIKRDWSMGELARRSGVSPSMVSMVISEQRRPGPEFCMSIAEALGYTDIYVFRQAGLLRPAPPNELPLQQEFLATARKLYDISPIIYENALTMLRGIIGDQTPMPTPKKSMADLLKEITHLEPAAWFDELVANWEGLPEREKLEFGKLLGEVVAEKFRREREGGESSKRKEEGETCRCSE